MLNALHKINNYLFKKYTKIYKYIIFKFGLTCVKNKILRLYSYNVYYI